MKRRFLTAGAVTIMVVGMLAGAYTTVLAANPGNTAGLRARRVPVRPTFRAHRSGTPKAAVTENAAGDARMTGTASARRSPAARSVRPLRPDHATARTFDSETTATGTANNASIFTGGGSKDQQTVEQLELEGRLRRPAGQGQPAARDVRAIRPRGTTPYIFFGADRLRQQR